MNEQSLKEFKKFVREWQKQRSKAAWELICELFIELGFNKQNKNYFLENASTVIEEIRWKSFKELKNREIFSLDHVFEYLFKEAKISDPKTKEIIVNFLKQFHEHLYSLNLSLTQSRRSRTGKEFESIIELIFSSSNIPVNNQSVIKNKDSKKLIDFISPSSVEYQIDKDKVIFISVKTTLRERWQEVIDEINRAEITKIFLITLDEKLTKNLLHTCKQLNIQLVTLKSVKEKYYFNSNEIISIEELLNICKNNLVYWINYDYSEKERQEIREILNKQLKKYSQLQEIKEYYLRKIKEVSESNQ
ncbi:hypothetical protein A6V39_04330 [Candidatus Mycoplasma haematobovis]|uniref:Restriction endonuclease type II EcoRII C-terminal domain-containing protein n=1 Tax=Candidatus Mycoplasma haematobovis TaxID=432608 RepID=A0A1A9QCD9_9MOLU|nr:type II restriction endonuclease [Candidatus Mycoplasma haematobovis]OAL10113.1 hypothetical protein A6V39_04330 [Candidatus Mycoplasma haematobovis]